MRNRCDAIRGRLSDFIDGELPEEVSKVVEAHLRRCELCADECARLASMIEAIGTVPEVPVPESVWDRIIGTLDQEETATRGTRGSTGPAGRIGPFLSRFRSLPRRPAWVAAVSVVAVVVLVLSLPGREVSHPGAWSGKRMAASALEEARGAELQYIGAIEALEARAATRRSTLPVGIAVELERNLEMIDAMIATYRRALAGDPESLRVQARLLDAYGRKMSLLERIGGIEI